MAAQQATSFDDMQDLEDDILSDILSEMTKEETNLMHSIIDKHIVHRHRKQKDKQKGNKSISIKQTTINNQTKHS